MRIGEFSRHTGVSVRMLRYYESQGLLQPTRIESGYRVYGIADAERVKRIVLLNKAGLTLERIRPVLACEIRQTSDFRPCEALKKSLQRTVTQLDEQIAGLAETRRMLVGLIGEAQ